MGLFGLSLLCDRVSLRATTPTHPGPSREIVSMNARGNS